jgi:outer membrane protein assembly factor BamD (BamD/ComL family)
MTIQGLTHRVHRDTVSRMFRYLKYLLPILFLSLTVQAQFDAPQQDEDSQQIEQLSKSGSRRRAHFWNRPRKSTPDEQLIYAGSLEKARHYRSAIKQYDALVRRWHDNPVAAVAQFNIANLFEKRGKYEKAFDQYQYLIDNFSDNFSYETVLKRQFAIANYLRARRYGKLWFGGFDAPERALPYFQKILRNAPDWSKAPECLFILGLIHEQKKEYMSAVQAYEKVQIKYPKSPYAATASFHRGQCLAKIADKNRRDEESARKAVSALAAFTLDYPADSNVKAARKLMALQKKRLEDMAFDRAVFYDRIAHKPKAAVIAYTDFMKKFPGSDRTANVKKRLSELSKEIPEDEK